MSFVLSSGVVARLQPAAATLLSAMPGGIQLSQTQWRTYEAMWKSQPALRTVVSFLARNVAELGLGVFERVSDTDRKKRRDHPLAKLLADPFPGSKWTTYRLFNWTVQEKCIFDSAIWLKLLAPDASRAVLPVPRRMIELRGDNAFAVEKYRMHGTKGFKDLDPDQVVHFNGYNPDDVRDGFSPIETLRQILAEEWAAGRYREQLWRNGARIGGYISRAAPPASPKWSVTAKERFRADWNEQYAGDGLAAGGTPILEDGMTYTPSGITPRDAQYVEARQLTREEVCVAYHVNPQMLGIVGGQQASDIPEMRKMLYADTCGPLLEEIQQDLEQQLLSDVDPGGAGKFYVEFNLRKKMQGSFEEQAAALSASVGGPWMTRNEARALQNLPELPEAEDLITPLNVTAGGLASPRDTAPDNPSNEESNGELPGPKPAVTGG